ncbi:MAG: hypothetical protein M1159_01505 [Candidatus Thermoplasmatota archaeon]|jgi:hypothetical protein|nr:hypothetical protein [Candidatus Thermoplasmatota archaeon]MCL5787650.1 hypothetical protein [Candidatus Thermoplasmatota archaeon]
MKTFQKRNYRYEQREPVRPKRIKKLNMRKSDEFNYMLGRIVEGLPDSIRGSIMGSVYAIASKKGIREAKDFILKKGEEGLISEDIQKKLTDLVFDYSTYR